MQNRERLIIYANALTVAQALQRLTALLTMLPSGNFFLFIHRLYQLYITTTAFCFSLRPVALFIFLSNNILTFSSL